MVERTGQPEFAHAGRALDDQVVPLLDPAAESELLEQRPIQPARGAVIDALDGGLVAQPGIAQPRPQSSVLAVGEFAVEQQAEPFGMLEFGTAWAGGQFLEGARHPGKAELAQLVERGMGQQGSPPQW